MKLSWLRPLALLAGAAALVTGCGGGSSADGIDGGIGGTGVVRFQLTDAPACGYEAVHVTVEKVLIHASALAADGDSGWREVVLAPARRLDLLTLTNGTLEALGQLRLPAGTYGSLRLVLAANNASRPLANAVTPEGGSETALDTPSAQQSGLKVNTSIDVPAGREADVIIDFDACQSVVRRGTSGRYNLKPVLRVTTVLADAGLRIRGWVAAAQAATTRVSAQRGGVEVAAAQPLAGGAFVLYPLPVGTYDVVVTGTGRATHVVLGVPSVSGSPTDLFPQAAPLAPAPGASGVATLAARVQVPAGGDAADVAVQATQALTRGTVDPLDDVVVQVAQPGVVAEPDATDGDVTLVLPVDAPQVADYAAAGTPLAFSADAVGSAYQVAATFDGEVRSTGLDAAAPPPDPLSFDFTTFTAVTRP